MLLAAHRLWSIILEGMILAFSDIPSDHNDHVVLEIDDSGES